MNRNYSCFAVLVSHYYSFLQQSIDCAPLEAQPCTRCCRRCPQSGCCGQLLCSLWRKENTFMEHLLCVGPCAKHFICIIYFNSNSDRMGIIVYFINEEAGTENCNKSHNTKKLINGWVCLTPASTILPSVCLSVHHPFIQPSILLANINWVLLCARNSSGHRRYKAEWGRIPPVEQLRLLDHVCSETKLTDHLLVSSLPGK